MTWNAERLKEEAGRLPRRLANLVRRVRYVATSSAGLWQAGAGVEDWAEVEVFGGVGFVSRPKDGSKGAEAILVHVGGASTHPVIVATRDRSVEFTLELDDETAIANSSSVVYIKKDGTIEARSRGGTAVALATKADVQAVVDVLTTWTVAPNDGGGALKTKAIADLASIPAGTSKLKGE